MPITRLALRGRCQRLAPRARLSIMARSPSAPPTEAGDTTAVGTRAPIPSRARFSLREESRYGLLGGERVPRAHEGTLPSFHHSENSGVSTRPHASTKV